MKQLFYILTTLFAIHSCGSANKTLNTSSQSTKEEIVVIENDSLEFKIIISDIGYTTYLNSIAKPANFYSKNYYEIKNIFYVSEWNNRANNPMSFGDFYGNSINYSPQIDYGLEVNYKLFNYFKFIEYKYKIRF